MQASSNPKRIKPIKRQKNGDKVQTNCCQSQSQKNGNKVQTHCLTENVDEAQPNFGLLLNYFANPKAKQKQVKQNADQS